MRPSAAPQLHSLDVADMRRSPSKTVTHYRLGALDAWDIVMWACDVMRSGAALGNDSALIDVAGLCRAEAEEASVLLARLVKSVEPEFDDGPGEVSTHARSGRTPSVASSHVRGIDGICRRAA